jgi:hypothetical protein
VLPSLLSFSNCFGQKRKALFEIVVDELIYLKFYSLSLLSKDTTNVKTMQQYSPWNSPSLQNT